MKSELETLVSLETLTTVSDEAAQEINSLLRCGIDAAKNGNRDEAKALLFRVTDIDPENEMAWLWLASVSEYPEELLTFLQKVLNINPQNEQALEWERSTKGLLARNLVQYGITAVQENKKESAKRCFLRALETDESNEMAWLWMASISDDPDEKTAHLEKVLTINPANEVANTLLKLQRKDEAQELLQKSKASAVRGDRREALEMLEQVKHLDAELEDAWILQAHLAESFEEKAFCFNQALACNPGNEVARVGLASLESILQAVNGNGNGHVTQSLISPELEEEMKAGEETENVVEESFPEDTFAEEIFVEENVAEESFTGEEAFAEEEASEPEALSSPENLSSPEALSSDAEETYFTEEEVESALPAFFESSEPEEFSDTEHSFDADTGDLDQEMLEQEMPDQEIVEEEPAASYFDESAAEAEEVEEAEAAEAVETQVEEDTFAQSEFSEAQSSEVEEEAAEDIKAETFYFGQNETEEETAASFTDRNTDHDEDQGQEEETPASEAEEFASLEDTLGENTLEEDTSGSDDREVVEEVTEEMQVFEAAAEQTPFAQMSDCPFCGSENNINDEVCNGCNAVLGLHNLDMLLSRNGADNEKLSEAVENMEANLESDSFSAEEYFNLGLACLNLKDLDSGLKYLQKSYILNPTNSFLKSQIDELAKRMDGQKDESQDSVEGAVAGKTVLVVDDSATIRKLVSAKLEKHGHNVISAVDGMDALAKLEEIVPDLILLDITMPRLDGYQVCKLIRANENTRFVPIVLISGKDGFFDKVRGKMCGSTTYITKPFGPEMLLRTVEAYFQ